MYPNIRIETTTERGTRAWDIPAYVLDDQEKLDYSLQDLNCYLREYDTGLDGNGSFVTQVYRALCDVLDFGRRKALVLAYSEYCEMEIAVVPVDN